MSNELSDRDFLTMSCGSQSMLHQKRFMVEPVGSSLLGIKADVWVVKGVRVFNGLSKEEDWRQELMDLAVGNPCVPLKVGFARVGCVVQLLKHFFFL